MKTETYAGRKISARALKGAEWGRIEIKLNGNDYHNPLGSDVDKAIADLKNELDYVDEWTANNGVDGDMWPAVVLRPGTFEMCSLDLHPRDIGGVCQHSWCVKHRCQWDMPDDVQPDSIQCRDTASDDGIFCGAHADLNHNIAIAADAASGK